MDILLLIIIVFFFKDGWELKQETPGKTTPSLPDRRRKTHFILELRPWAVRLRKDQLHKSIDSMM